MVMVLCSSVHTVGDTNVGNERDSTRADEKTKRPI